jgi:hypothetical protein
MSRLLALVLAGAAAFLLACASQSSPAASAAPASAPPRPAAAAGPLPGDQLDELVARVALYPDALLAVVLPASTKPGQILEAAGFLDARERDPKTQPSASWDDAVRTLLNYPDVIRWMSRDLAWTQALGEAVATQQGDVMDAIQQVRTRAMAAGHLKTNEKWIVTQENGIISIESADPDVIFVPIYDPTVIYVESSKPAVSYYPPYPCYWCPGAAFGMGMMWGFGWYYDEIYWDDDDIDIDYDRPYRPDRPDRPRPTPHERPRTEFRGLPNQDRPDRPANVWKPGQPVAGSGAARPAAPSALPARPGVGGGSPASGAKPGGPTSLESLTKLPSSYQPTYRDQSGQRSYGGYQRGQDARRAGDRGAQSRGVSSGANRSRGSYGSSYGGYGRGSSASAWGSRGAASRGGMGGGGMRGGGGGGRGGGGRR